MERIGREVLKQLIDERGLQRETAKPRLHKLGSNRSLDEVCDHVAEALVSRSLDLTLSSYPYLGVQNGVLNLITRTLVPARYRVLSPFQAGVHYDPTATAPLFRKTVGEIFEDDEEMIAFMYRVMGYMLLGKGWQRREDNGTKRRRGRPIEGPRENHCHRTCRATRLNSHQIRLAPNARLRCSGSAKMYPSSSPAWRPRSK